MTAAESQPGESAPIDGRQALLEAAASIVAQKGLRGLTYRAVAAEAGVTYGLVFHHFGSRDAMIAATMSFVAHRSMADSWLQRETAALDEIGDGITAMTAEGEAAHAFMYELGLEARRRVDLAPELRMVYDEYLALMRRQLGELGFGDEPALAELVFAALDGLVLQRVLFGRERDVEPALATLRRLLGTLVEGRR